jgi:hypothetical protein
LRTVAPVPAAAAPAWSDAHLDALRHVGDPLADATIDALFREGEVEEVTALFAALVRNDDALAPATLRAQLSPRAADAVLSYLAQARAAQPDVVPPAVLERGQRLFARRGPEVLLVLGTYSLPAAYAAAKGVQVLWRTGRLELDARRRLWETTQMVVDVLTPGGLDDGPEGDGRGLRTAQKVRLMHAAIRRLIQTDRRTPWDPAWGVPINQEDLAGTFTTFSWVVLDGLHKLGGEVDPADADAYVRTWGYVASILGVRSELLPDTVADARVLTETIQRRQIARSAEGVALTRALLEMLAEQMGGGWFAHRFPAALMRHFLGHWAEVIEVPRADVAGVAVELLHRLCVALDELVDDRRFSRWLMGRANLLLIDALLRRERDGQRAPFEIPTALLDGWGADEAARAAVRPR